MASTTSTPLSLYSSSTAIIDNKLSRQSATASPSQRVTLPSLPPPPVQSQSRASRTTTYCRKIARNVVAMAAGEAPVATEVAPVEATTTGEAPVATEVAPVEATATGEAPVATEVDTSEIVKTIQEAWEKVEDKYAVSSLAVAGLVALVGSSGMISAIDRLPLVPGVLELVGIGYTGWFAYKNLIFKPDREALIKKIKDTYNDIIGSS